MRRLQVALASAALGMLASAAPALAYEGNFFLDPPDKSQGHVPADPSAEPESVSVHRAKYAEPAYVAPGGGVMETQPQMTPIPRETVAYDGPYSPGTIVISTEEKRLYLILPDHQALRYGVGVGRPGFEWSGMKTITAKREWPDWTPPPEMIKRRPDLPRHMEGGIENPLGARAMYLGGTMYRIHGSNEPDTIGQAVSSGCIRMTNDDVVDLYERVKVGTKAIVQR
jgi:lipoprotein-anchoring transpeptidase ErfK/SrfK